MDSELTGMTAAALAAAIAAGEVSAAEVTEAHLARIGAVDTQVRAFLHVAADSARAAAQAVDERRGAGEVLGPLAGVPLALKDVFTTLDMPTTCGSRILEGWQPPYDATITRRLREAGVVILGKLGLPQERMVVTVGEHGNTSAASIPLAFDVAVRDGRIKRGQNVLIEGVGGGFTWGASVIRY